jgi:predicted dinucleotide-binding enzyme
MKLGVLGTGHVATTLAGAWNKTHEITLASCGDPR